MKNVTKNSFSLLSLRQQSAHVDPEKGGGALIRGGALITQVFILKTLSEKLRGNR